MKKLWGLMEMFIIWIVRIVSLVCAFTSKDQTVLSVCAFLKLTWLHLNKAVKVFKHKKTKQRYSGSHKLCGCKEAGTWDYCVEHRNSIHTVVKMGTSLAVQAVKTMLLWW